MTPSNASNAEPYFACRWELSIKLRQDSRSKWGLPATGPEPVSTEVGNACHFGRVCKIFVVWRNLLDTEDSN